MGAPHRKTWVRAISHLPCMHRWVSHPRNRHRQSPCHNSMARECAPSRTRIFPTLLFDRTEQQLRDNWIFS